MKSKMHNSERSNLEKGPIGEKEWQQLGASV